MGHDIKTDMYCHELNTIKDNFELILKNRAVIYEEKRLFFCPTSCAYIGSTIFDIAYLSLGVLLKLWESSDFMEECPDCGNTAYIINAVGSLCSGSNQYKAICSKCKKDYIGMKESLNQFFEPARELHKKYREKQYEVVEYLLDEVIEYLKRV